MKKQLVAKHFVYVRWWSSGVGRRIFKPAKIRRK
jgi:hypothetical protein